MTTVNFEILRNLYTTDSKAKAIFDRYSQRERGRQDSTADRMRRILREVNIEMTPEELSKFYAKMQEAGVGRCIIGRHGRANRFIWSFHLKSVADAARGAQTVLKVAPRAKVKLPHLKAHKPVQAVAAPKPAPVIFNPAPTQVSDKVVVKKAGFIIELPLHMSLEDWKEAAVFLNNLDDKT